MYTLLTIGLLDRAFGNPLAAFARYTLAAAAFTYSVYAFPPMPWHTVDGLLLGALAIAALRWRRPILGPVVGAAFAVGAASCKQSYFFFPALALIYLIGVGRRRAAVWYVSTAGVLVVLGAAAMAVIGVLPTALEQMTGQTRLSSLLYAGAVRYGKSMTTPVAAGLIAVGLVQWALRRTRGRGLPSGFGGYLALVAVFGPVLVVLLREPRFHSPPFNYPATLFVVAALTVLVFLKENREGAALLALSLSLAWCASVSWGYPTPVLFGAPAVFGALLAARRWMRVSAGAWVGCFLVGALAVQVVAYRHPYGEAPRSELDRPLAQAFERFRGVRSSAETVALYEELASMLPTDGSPFTVLPARPLAHFLADQPPPIQVDWARNAETDGRTDELIERLETTRPLVLVERAAPGRCEGEPHCSDLTSYVVTRWCRVRREANFDAYRSCASR
jgi:hypothetical protein